MGEWPEAVREYEENRVGFPVIERTIADAAIAALKELLEECEFQQVTKSDKDRIAILEAEVERLKARIGSYQDELTDKHNALLDAEAEVERLKWMLDEAYRQVPGAREWKQHDWLADLAARWEEEHADT